MGTILVFKLLTMPVVMTTATLAGRRFGPAVAGLILGLPIVSGPISVFVAIEQGVPFAQRAATGTLLGLIALAAYALAYGHAAQRLGWIGSLVCGLATTVVSVTLLNVVEIPEPAVIWVTCAAVAAVIWLCPGPGEPVARPPAPGWDLPARIAVATAFMLTVTVAAEAIGPAMTGMASTFPVMLSVMAPFTHRVEGRAAVVAMMRGCAEGLVTFALFFQVLRLLLGVLPPVAAYLIALAASLALALVVLLLQRRRAVAVR